LSGKISKTYNKDKSGAIVSTTFYSYDVYGRISWTVQNINGVGAKTIDYEYDPVTSKVKRVIFQKHVSSEMFIHRYTYNSSEQLVKVETSTNGSSYTTHADYTFNAAGLTKRISIAEGIQGIDYVYNLNGQLKAINHPSLSSSKDPGGDSNDLFGMVIDYNDDDYSRDSDFNLTTPSGFNQYTGNVKAVTWNTQGIGSVGKMDTYYYGYNDQHWLEWAYKNTTPTSSANATGISFSSMSSGNYNVFGITYDPNGNIKTLSRNKNNDGLGNAMDRLTYHYEGGSSNQLDYVDDTVTFFTNADDIKDQTVDNYRYDALGQLKDDMYEGLSYEYTSTGRVSRIRKNGQIQVDFKYNERGQRVRKITYLNGFPSLNTYYIRDYAGNVVGVYENSAIKENPIYGLARLGIYNRPANTNFYQITDHLGTVRAVISKSGPNTAALVSAADNYPYGMTLPGREIIGGQPYRYAFQGQEKDPETGKEAFKLRLWDARLGRWLTPDPYGQFESPYMGMGNNPVSSIDPDGGFSSSFMAWVLNFLFFDLMGEVVEGQDGDWMIKKDGKEISDFKSLAKTFKYKKEDFFIHKSGFKYDKIKLKTPDTKHSLKDWSNASKGNKIEEAKKETYWGNSLSKVDTKILSLMKNVAMDADGTGLDSYFKRNPVSLSLGAFHYDEEYGELNITHGVDATIHKTIHYIGAIRDGSSSMKNKSEMSKRKVIANPVLEFGNLFLHTTSSNGNKISTLGN
jgi:RHS repeat-associated protein